MTATSGAHHNIGGHRVLGPQNLGGEVRVLVVEGVAPVQHGVQDDADGPHVCFLQAPPAFKGRLLNILRIVSAGQVLCSCAQAGEATTKDCGQCC